MGKKYLLRHQAGGQRYRALRDVLTDGFKTGFGLLRRAGNAPTREEFWALKDVSFEVNEGEVVGIIGRNGAGKSTLLKILSRITEPTTGRVTLDGRVASLLEVGTGFHPELTGRENIYLNGSILGMSRAEIARKFDEIVAFAEVEKFLDTPVKRYSSGMYVRLAFAVAAHLEPEILVVDEVLAVGDAEFQKKCLGKMSEVARGGRTVLFVSHNMHAVKSLCRRGIVLNRGQREYDGDVGQAVEHYLAQVAPLREAANEPNRRPGTGEWRVTSADPRKPAFDPAETKAFLIRVEPRQESGGAVHISAHVVDAGGITLVQCDSRLVGLTLGGSTPHELEFRLRECWLKPGRYSLDVNVCSPSGFVDHVERACEFHVTELLPYPHTATADATASGIIFTNFSWGYAHGGDGG